MVALADIKKDLPGWPDEVIEEWLVYLANRDDTGWPPPDPLSGSWEGILGGRPLSWWRDVTWATETVDCSLGNLAAKTRGIAAGIRAEVNAGTADDVTKRRFKHALHHIFTNGTFPNPVSAMKVDGRLLVMDGNHRVAALTAAQILPDALLQEKGWQKAASEQSVWIGTHANGEVPLT
jgi:hypothetical protein